MAERRWGTGKLGDGRLAMPRIWPHWTRSIGAMLAGGVIVRFACLGCRRVFDVDLASLAALRGSEWSLLDRRARCKASKCRAPGLFVAAAGRHEPFLLLGTKAALPTWLAGTTPADHEPPPPTLRPRRSEWTRSAGTGRAAMRSGSG